MQQYDRRNSSNEYGELFIGDYDLRVLVSAIENHGYFVRQVNVNRDRTLKSYPWDSFFGLLINQNGEHWFAIKSFEGIYHNLDSTFSRPVAIGDMARLIYHLNFLIDCGYQIYIFAVTKTKTQFWVWFFQSLSKWTGEKADWKGIKRSSKGIRAFKVNFTGWWARVKKFGCARPTKDNFLPKKWSNVTWSEEKTARSISFHVELCLLSRWEKEIISVSFCLSRSRSRSRVKEMKGTNILR